MRLWFMSWPWSGDMNWLWIDFTSKSLGYWYVFIWRRGRCLPFMYRSTDATPPGSVSGEGNMIFGTYS